MTSEKQHNTLVRVLCPQNICPVVACGVFVGSGRPAAICRRAVDDAIAALDRLVVYPPSVLVHGEPDESRWSVCCERPGRWGGLRRVGPRYVNHLPDERQAADGDDAVVVVLITGVSGSFRRGAPCRFSWVSSGLRVDFESLSARIPGGGRPLPPVWVVGRSGGGFSRSQPSSLGRPGSLGALLDGESTITRARCRVGGWDLSCHTAVECSGPTGWST